MGRGVGTLEASRNTETGQDRRPPGRCPFQDPRRSGELGRPRQRRGFRKPWRDRLRGRGPKPPPWPLWLEPLLPPQNFLGESRGSIGHLGALWMHGHLGALWRKRIRGAGTVEERALESAVEERALAWKEPQPAGLPYSLQAGLPYSLPAGLLWPRTAACEEEPRTATGLRGPRAAGLRGPRTVASISPRTVGLKEPRTAVGWFWLGPRHRKIPSLQLSPEVSGRSTG